MRDNEVIFPLLVDALILSRDWRTAGELVRSNSNEELPYVLGAIVKDPCQHLWFYFV
jgi:hypothetical protein